MTISTFDFSITKVSHGEYEVTYTSPITGKDYVGRTNNSRLIDDFTEGEVTQKDLQELKRIAKGK